MIFSRLRVGKVIACVFDLPPACWTIKSRNAAGVGVIVRNWSSSTSESDLKRKPRFKMIANLEFSGTLTKSDPKVKPVTIIGRLEYLKKLSFDKIKTKLEPRVSEETYLTALECLQPSPTDSCPLYLSKATIAALPTHISRHNTPSRAHSITKIASESTAEVDQFFVIVCEKSDVFASALAVARAFPLFTRKSNLVHVIDEVGFEGLGVESGEDDRDFRYPVVTMEFLIVSENGEIGVEELKIEELLFLRRTAHCVREAARVVDSPCNHMNTTIFLDNCLELGGDIKVRPKYIRGEDLRKQGFGGMYGVGRAAEEPPVFIIFSHTPKGATKTVAWVGKGIVFDTGGLSIKDKLGMCGMKRDCGGAAAVLYAFSLAVQSGFTENLHAVLCVAENAVGPMATRPDDILYMLSKKTVEVNNTDAEGRLVLADGVFYAKTELKADIIVDVATLTGAQGITTGKYHAAILTNSEEWEQAGVRAGKSSGDLVFPIVFSPELHFSEFASSVADMKNSAKDRSNAGASCAGLFIFSHLGFDFPGVWVHLDIAYPVENGERATGYGVALLSTLFGHMSSNSMLKALSPWGDTEKK